MWLGGWIGRWVCVAGWVDRQVCGWVDGQVWLGGWAGGCDLVIWQVNVAEWLKNCVDCKVS